MGGGFATPLVGRDRQLAALVEMVVDAPSVCLVTGEAGIGKTRLVRELLEHEAARSRHVLQGAARSLRERFPLGPVVDAMRGIAEKIPYSRLTPVAAALRPFLPELDARLPAPERPPDPRVLRHQAFRAVREILAELGPSVLVLDDLHWADDWTEDLILYLWSDMPPQLCMILTYRQEDMDPTSRLLTAMARPPTDVQTHATTLEPLNAREVGRLVQEILGADQVSDEFAGYLRDRTSGLPFAVEEVVRILVDRRDLVSGETGWQRKELDEMEAPPAIRDAIQRRASELPGPAQAMLRGAAILEHAEEEELLGRVAGVTNPEKRLQALSRGLSSGFLEEKQGRYAFRHALFEQAVRESILQPERRRLHLRAARALESAPHDPSKSRRLARHYREAGRIEDWLRYAELAAEEAVSVGDDAGACGILMDAVRHPAVAGDRAVRLAEQLGRSALHGLQHEEAIPLLRGLVEGSTFRTEDRAKIRYHLGHLLIQAGDAEDGFSEIVLAAQELPPSSPLKVRALVNLAWPWQVEGNIDGHLRALDEAMKAVVTNSDSILRMSVLADRAFILLSAGESDAWEAIDAIPGDEESGQGRRQRVRASLNLASAAFWLGHYRFATARANEGVKLSSDVNYPRFTAALSGVQLLLDWAQGKWEGLEARARTLMEVGGRHVDAALDARFVGYLLSLAQGPAPRLESFPDALADFRAAGAIPMLVAATAAWARYELAHGAIPEAATHTEEVLDLVARKGVWVWGSEILPVAVHAAIASRRIEKAEEILTQFRAGIDGKISLTSTPALRMCEASLAQGNGDLKAALELFGTAESAWLGLPRPYDAAWARERAGECLVHLRDPAGSRVLSDALASYQSLGATRDAARLRRRLRHIGIAVPARWRGGRRGYGGELSPREREVAKLAAHGETNREIAAELYLSHRTVEHHLARALEKLGLESRRELVRGDAAVHDQD